MKKLLVFLFAIVIGSAFAETKNITWDVNGTTYATSTCEVGGDLIIPQTNPTKYGYNFVGWVRVNFLNSLNYSDWTSFTNSGTAAVDGDEFVYTITQTPTTNSSLRGGPSFSMAESHKLYITFDIFLSKAPGTGKVCDTNGSLSNHTVLSDVSWNKANAWQTVKLIGTTNATGRNFQCHTYPLIYSSGWDVGDYWKFRNYKVFDLTALFGAGNEPTTLADIESAGL